LRADAIDEISRYWEAVRLFYRPFESQMRSGSSDVYEHEMPGGQYTNLREQAQGLGLGDRWPTITKTYAEVNAMFGDIVKVTPTSKVVGDMALFMVSGDLTRAAVEDPAIPIDFPQSVVEFFAGYLGQPPGGFPAALQAKVLRGKLPLTERPGATLPPADFAALRAEAERLVERRITDNEFASYLMYPSVFVEFAATTERYGDVGVLATPVFFYGMDVMHELEIELERGKTLSVRFAALGEPDEAGQRTVYFELNGQSRPVVVRDTRLAGAKSQTRKAEKGNERQIGAPMPGQIVKVNVSEGLSVHRGDPILTLEAMKMQTVLQSPLDGTITEVLTRVGARVAAGDLLVEFG
jgi:pyruvate carboxylase